MKSPAVLGVSVKVYACYLQRCTQAFEMESLVPICFQEREEE